MLVELGVRPDCMAGHSFGEFTALYAAGALSFEDLIRAARRRGELIADAAASIPGAMTAVSNPREELESLLAAWASDVAVAKHNAPRQTILAGATSAVETVERRLAEEGITSRRLPVATAFHSPLVSGASERFLICLRELPMVEPAVPVYSNAEAAPYPADPEAARSLLAGLGARTVRFVEMVRSMHAAGARTFVEVGPGRALTGLVGQCLEYLPHTAIALDVAGRNGVGSLWHGLGMLAARSVPLDLDRLLRRHARPADPRTRERPRMAIGIGGANYAKPYPTGEAAAFRPVSPLASPTVPPARQVLDVVKAPATGSGLLEFVAPVTTIAVVGDADGVAPELTRRLAAAGYDARLLQSGDPAPDDVAGLVLLHGLAPITDPRDALMLYRQAFVAARAAAGGIQERGDFLATVANLGGRFGLGGCDPLRAWIGGLGSVAKTAGLEWEGS